MGTGKERTIALILSALVIPGAGQFYLKRRTRGTILALSTVFFLTYPLVHYAIRTREIVNQLGEDNSAVVNAIMALSQSWAYEKGRISFCFIAIILVWLIGILEIVIRKE